MAVNKNASVFFNKLRHLNKNKKTNVLYPYNSKSREQCNVYDNNKLVYFHYLLKHGVPKTMRHNFWSKLLERE